ncbi:MAG TPA: hypothetical protein VNE16_16230 [Vicinamibacterales bacterium]|nr:hypothetical protein [Vicinamibacterales bacterium]
MGDGGEGLIDADARIQERMDDLERARAGRNGGLIRNPEHVRTLESLKLARTDLNRQFEHTAHDARRHQISKAIEELDRRIAETMVLVDK